MFKSSKTKLLEEQLSVLQEELVSTKQKLQVTNTLFAGFLRQGDMNGYIIHVKSSGEIMNVSGAIYNVLGFLPEQIIGKRLSEITNTEDKRKVQECLCRELRYSGNIRRICRDNTFKIVESFACVMKDDASIVFTEWDITNIIGETKLNLSYLLNAFPHMAYIKDSLGVFCMVSESFALCCNKEVSYFENRQIIHKGGDLLFTTLYSNDSQIQDTNDTYSFEVEWPDGITRNVNCECHSIASINKGKFHGYKQPLYLYTITEQTKSESSGTHGAHFRCTYDSNEKKFAITYTTQSFSEIMEGKDFVKNIHKDDINMFNYSLEKISQTSHPWRWQGRIVIGKNMKRINIIAWPVVQNDCSDMLGLIQDLTNDTYEKKINMLVMRYASDVIALHTFQNDIKPQMKTFSHSMKDLLGHDSIDNDDFWKLHPDDSINIQQILYKMKRGIADTSTYRIKHKDNYWVNVRTEFIPFDNEFITITKRLG